MKVLALKRAGECRDCASSLAVGTRAMWDSDTRTVQCLKCAETSPTDPLAPAQPATSSPETAPQPQSTPASATPAAGASAQQEYQRRSQRRQERIRQRHPRLGGLILALANEPASTRVWAQGAAGERQVGATLEAPVPVRGVLCFVGTELPLVRRHHRWRPSCRPTRPGQTPEARRRTHRRRSRNTRAVPSLATSRRPLIRSRSTTQSSRPSS